MVFIPTMARHRLLATLDEIIPLRGGQKSRVGDKSGDLLTRLTQR